MFKIRCSQYWPTQIGLPVTHGPFTVITEREDITVDYTTRMITVKKNVSHYVCLTDQVHVCVGEVLSLSLCVCVCMYV
jgi:hypothetical protein